MGSSPAAGRRAVRQPRRQEVTDGIKHYILEHGLRPGDPLPTESALGEALEVSRSSVREAVKTLHALDIVEVRHGHGTYVGRLSLSALVESLTFRGLLGADDDMRVLSELLDARELFERGTAERVVAALDGDALDALDVLVDRMHTYAASNQELLEADRAFHVQLADASGNRLIGQLSVAFWDVYTLVAPHLESMTAGEKEQTVEAHRRIVAAARAGDAAEFSAALTAHYALARQRLDVSRARRSQQNGGEFPDAAPDNSAPA